MFFLFSGEGATDLGICANAAAYCEGDEYKHGPMAIIVSRIVEARQDYSILAAGCVGCLPESELGDQTNALKAIKTSVDIPGKKRRRETGFFLKNARALAQFAKRKESEIHDQVVAILFRDADVTRSSERSEWKDKFQSMLNGFQREGFQRGVPMLPKPKSEAWVLCAVKNQYSGCDALENRSGNDDLPRSLKCELAQHIGHAPSRELLCEMVEDGRIDFRRISMPSFTAFKNRLEEVI